MTHTHAKNQGQRSDGQKLEETNGPRKRQMDTCGSITFLANVVSSTTITTTITTNI